MLPEEIDSAILRKDRGAFFTPLPLAQFIADWAIRSPDDRVLEPSCGDAVFLSASGARLRELGTTAGADQLIGHDIHAQSLSAADDTLQQEGVHARLIAGDFFDVEPEASFDAAIGNPPYIRFQGFTGASRTRSLERALRAGVNLSGLASSWAAFSVHASSFLKPGGRLGLVLPTELLSVKYASPVREYLLKSFSSIELVLFEELVFQGVQTDVVVLLADGFGEGRTDHFRVYQAKNVESIGQRTSYRWSPTSPTARWTDALLSTSAAPLLEQMSDSELFTALSEWGTLASGTVTGANKYFALTPTEAAEQRLDPADLKRLLPPGLSLTPLDRFTTSNWKSSDAKTLLFYPRLPLNTQAAEYIRLGEGLGIPNRYKCRVRTPWWRVPLTKVPDVFVSYMSGSTPRIVANTAGAHHLNSIHGLRIDPSLRALAQKTLPLLALSSYSLLSAEIEGRSYGGGVLKLEPKEAARWLVPSPATARLTVEMHGTLLSRGTRLIRTGDLAGASEIADEILADLLRAASSSPIDSLAVRAARSELLRRRIARGGSKAPGMAEK